MAEMGRPVIEIDFKEFEKLCALACTQVEIAEWFDCSPDTIDRRVKEHYGETFAEVFKKKSSKGKISLRRKQFEVALTGNVTMLIWMGKQLLGQSDKQEIKQETHDAGVDEAKLLLEKLTQILSEK